MSISRELSTNRRQSPKPLIINGDMAVAQRGTSQTGQTGNHFPVDRFGFQMSTFGTWTSSQSTDVPTGKGFVTSLKLDCTTADTSLGAGDFGVIHYKFEGQDAQLFKKGTSSAKKVTLSFWVKSNKTGNYVIELFDVDNSRQISQLYSISSADTWEQKIVTFAGDTSGALDNDNGNSFVIHWALGAGSTYSGGTLNTSWAANNNANRWVGGPNLADSTDNEWYLTGVQLEVGDLDANSLPPFQHESHGDSLARCQRHCQVYGAYANTMLGFGHTHDQTNVYRWGFPLGVEMRAAPTASLSGTNGFWNGSIGANAVLGTSYNKTDLVDIDCTCDTGGLVNDQGRLTKLYMNTGTLTLDSEL